MNKLEKCDCDYSCRRWNATTKKCETCGRPICAHEDFAVVANVGRLTDTGRFTMDLKVECTQCNEPFRFIGLPAGLDLNGAATSADATEARLAIAPRSQVVSMLDGAPAGFSIRGHSHLANIGAAVVKLRAEDRFGKNLGDEAAMGFGHEVDEIIKGKP